VVSFPIGGLTGPSREVTKMKSRFLLHVARIASDAD